MQHTGSPEHCASEGAYFTYKQVQVMADFRTSLQQADQNMNDAPVSNIKGSAYLQFQAPSSNCAEMLAEVDGSTAKDLSIDQSTFGFPQDAQQEFSNQDLQYRYAVRKHDLEAQGFSVGVQEFVLNGGSAALGEYQNFDPFLRPLQPQRSEANYSRPSSASCLDHTDDITLSDTDGYSDRAISFGSSCSTGMTSYPYCSPLKSNHRIMDMRDGTWTALMQEAMEASTSDNELNEECSGLTFNNTVLSSGNTMQHQVVWDSGCLTSPSFTSNPLPSLGDAEANTNSNTVSSLKNFVDLPHGNGQGRAYSEIEMPQRKELTTSYLYQHQNQMHCIGWLNNSGHTPSGGWEGLMNGTSRIEESSGWLPITQGIQDNIAQKQFSSFVNSVGESMDSGTKKLHGLYECEEEMEIDSLLTSFDATSDAFPQTYEMVQASENFFDLDQKVKLEESNSTTCFSHTVARTQGFGPESALSDGSSCLQQYQSTSQNSGLICASACQWTSLSSAIVPSQAFLQAVSESGSGISLGTNGKNHLWPTSSHLVQQQQYISSGARLESNDDIANPYLECSANLDSHFYPKMANLCHDGAAEIQSALAAHSSGMTKCSFGVRSSTNAGHSDMQLHMTETMPLAQPSSLSLSKGPNLRFTGRTEPKKEVEQTGSHNTTHKYLVYNRVDHSQILPYRSFEQNASENVFSKRAVDQSDNDSQLVGPLQSVLLSPSKPSLSYGLPTKKFDDKVVSRKNKRKRATANLLAWHVQLMSGCGGMHCTRTLELDWAQSANRLVEKVDSENASMKNSTLETQARKRLMLTTRLIQYIFPVLPARLLVANVANSCGTIVYHISKLALRDTVGLVLSFVNDTHKHMENGNILPNQSSTSGKEDSKILSEVFKTFFARFGKLESEFSRIQKIPTMQELKAELSDFERWSILHHFVKMHAHAKADGADVSNSGAKPCRTALQKQVRVASKPEKLPSGIRCRSL